MFLFICFQKDVFGEMQILNIWLFVVLFYFKNENEISRQLSRPYNPLNPPVETVGLRRRRAQTGRSPARCPLSGHQSACLPTI